MEQKNASHDILSASYCDWNYVEKQLDSNTIKHKLFLLKLKTKLRGLSPRANYTERAAAAGRRS